ncbi:MAG: hypothetical protein M3R59_04010 [Verrucomicrobiota bacterium]|nr:hypothetical protein [Verrucomicrobiota bacterium]
MNRPCLYSSSIFLSLLFLVPILASARPVDFSEVSLLVRSRESDASIRDEVARRKLMRPLTPQQEATLKAQGASDSLLQSLRDSHLVASKDEVDALATSDRRRAAAQTDAIEPASQVRVFSVSVGQPINLSNWGGYDFDLVFRPADIVETGRPEAQLVHNDRTGTSFATYRGVRSRDLEPSEQEYTSIMDYTFARPLHVDWLHPRRVDGVPYNLYPVYASGRAALYFIGRSGDDSVTVAVVTKR